VNLKKSHLVGFEKQEGKGASDLMPRTPLGRRLWTIRRGIVASGTSLLSWEEIDREIATRREGWIDERE
jgi:hypothetical protein